MSPMDSYLNGILNSAAKVFHSSRETVALPNSPSRITRSAFFFNVSNLCKNNSPPLFPDASLYPLVYLVEYPSQK